VLAASAAVAMLELVGQLSAGATRSFLQGVKRIAELAAVAARFGFGFGQRGGNELWRTKAQEPGVATAVV